VRAARGLAAQRRAERLPQVGAVAGYVKMEAPQDLKDLATAAAAATGADIDADDLDAQLYMAGFDASWELDLFGRRRRAAEEAVAKLQASEAALADAQVQVAAEVGQAYVDYRGLQQRIEAAEQQLEDARTALQLTRQRRERGADSDLQVERAQTQLRQQEAALPPLQAERDQRLDQLAVLVGREPGALDADLAAPRPLPELPAQVAVDDPASVIRRRPDVRKAEREVAAANAQIGQALSGYFPQVTLMGTLGAGASEPSGLDAGAASTLFVPYLRWSLFDFGRVRAQVEQARAGTQARVVAYQATVLAALQDANTALSQFGAARRQLLAAQQARDSADRAAALMGQRNAAGAASQLDLLDVQRQQLSARDGALQAQVLLLVRYIGLHKSLGLGWQDAPAPELPADARKSD
ncbi:MAG: efflux transporter outer membrane subunit, partial [Pseudoxanthomonas sp.]